MLITLCSSTTPVLEIFLKIFFRPVFLSRPEEVRWGSGNVGASDDGKDHRGGLLLSPLLRLTEPAGEALQGVAWVEQFRTWVYPRSVEGIVVGLF